MFNAAKLMFLSESSNNFKRIIALQQLKIVTLCQLVRHCFTFWESKIKLTHINKNTVPHFTIPLHSH